jgi:alanine racemase
MQSGARLTIDLGALAANYADLAARAAPAQCAAVVKANAYGTGLERAAPALAGAGCKTFFVATPDEAVRLRSVLPSAVIHVLDGLLPGAAADYAAHDLRPVLGNPAEIEEWSRFCAARPGAPQAAIHIDTGMNRLGLDERQVKQLAAQTDLLAPVKLALVISHLACADDPADHKNADQLADFTRLRAALPEAPASLANSAGIFLGPAYHFDLVRPGIALYGGEAVNGVKNPMRPVVTIEAQIAQIREVKAGETIGYGAAYRCKAPSRIATLPIGYADGIFRCLGEAATHVCVGGHPAPFVGRVSMDLITIDVTAIPEHIAHRGAWVELVGKHNSVDDLARHAGTIGYEILTSLGNRTARVYVSETA